MICQSFTRSAVLLHGLFSATCDTDLLSSTCAFTFRKVRSQFCNLLFQVLNRLVLFLELIKTIARWPVTVVCKKLLSAQ